MNAVQFTFSPDASLEQQSETLREIRSWPEVEGAGPIKPNAADPDLARTIVVYTQEDADPEAVRDRISQRPEVREALIPPVRTALSR